MHPTRTRIFVDFWNFQLSWNECVRGRGFNQDVAKIPWEETLPRVLVQRSDPGGLYVGTHVYASIDRSSTRDKGLQRFLHAMDGFAGYRVTVKERRPASSVRCANEPCRREITTCPHCNERLRRTVEKGIDTTLLTDLIKAAFDNTFDQAILLTEDSDFVPAVEFIQERWSKQVIHAFFRGKSDELRNACWKHIFIDDSLAELLPGLHT
ncbi:MAG: NYN domain-containing protein [Acidobacteria bacterium]|nr:NYN domain-containing protein [Acidobacteriota bacterium]